MARPVQPDEDEPVNGRYRIIRSLGEGGMGTVLLASDLAESGRPVALKRLRVTGTPAKEALRSEFEALARLRHPNIVEVLDLAIDRATGDPILTMEAIEGGDLISGTGSMGWRGKLDCIVQICRGLNYIHARGVVHNDLKPQNILLTRMQPPTCKLTDFGLASVRGGDAGSIRGTVLYIAPEVLQGGPPGIRSDLWGLGVIAYQCLTERLPYEGTPSTILNLVATASPEPPRRWNPDLPEGVERVVLRLLSRDPVDRPAGAGDVIEALSEAMGEPFHVETAETVLSWARTAPLVGRKVEMEHLRGHLSAILDPEPGGAGRLVSIAGEMGAGKTRLISELRREAQARGALFATSSCYEGTGAPFHPFIEILKQCHPAALRDAALQPLFTSRADDAGHQPSAGAGDPEHEQRRLMDATATSLLGVASGSPLVVVIENLHWADAASTRLIEHLTRNTASTPGILLVTTHRTENTDTPGFDETLGRILGAGDWDRLELKRLSREEIAAMLAGMFDLPAVPETLTELISRETDGNPLFVQVAVESLLEEHAALAGGAGRRIGADLAGSLESLTAIPFPRSITEAIGRRLSRITPDQARLLEALAVAETPAGGDVLAKVLAPDLTPGAEPLDASMEALMAARIVERSVDKDGSVRLRIDHVRTREHVYETMDWNRRSELHGRFGIALEAVPDAELETIAHHFVHSSDTARALEYGERAGMRAAAMFATHRAITFLERALDLVPPGDAPRRLRIQLGLSDLQWRAGDPAVAQEMAERVIRGARSAGLKDVAWKASCRLAMVQTFTGRVDEAERSLDRLIQNLRSENDASSLAYCLTTRANIEASRGRFEESRSLNEEALELRRALGDREGMTANLNNLGNLDLVLGPTDRGRSIFEENIAIRKEMSDLRRAADSLTNLGQWHRRRGALEAAAACSMEACDIASRLRDRWSRATYATNHVLIERLRGRPAAARDAAHRAISDGRAMGHHQSTCEAFDYLGMVERDLGRWAEAADAHRQGAAIARAHGLGLQESFLLSSLVIDRLTATGTRPEAAEIRDLIRRAARAAGDSKSPRLSHRVLECHARLALLEGNLESALEKARGSAREARSHNMSLEEVEAHLLVAECLLSDLPGGGGGRDTDAFQAAEAAAGLMETSGILESMWRAHAFRAEAAARGGRRAEEREHLSAAVTLIEQCAARCEDEAVRRALLTEPRRADLLRRAAAVPEIALRRGGETDVAAGGALAAMYQISEIISSMSHLDDLLDRLLEVGLGIVAAERGLIILIDETTGEQVVRAARDLEKETVEDALTYSHSVVKEASTGRVMVALDAEDDERLRSFRSVSLYSIKSLMCVPIRMQKTILGTVYVDSRRRGTPFSQKDLKFLEAFANLAGAAIHQARLHERLALENTSLRKEVGKRDRYQSIIGQNAKMQTVYDLVEKVAPTSLPVLIEGESGTGKELVARALHFGGPRRRRPFQTENVAAIPENLLESEMFGHVKGAFTGADRDRKGIFELADGGTLFLDEIGDMPQPMQVKLLRVLQEGEIRPVGGKETRKVDVRVISATNKDLALRVREGTFREDLYYRINGVRIPLPPLRERKDDIPRLVDHFLAKSAEPGTTPRRMEISALQLLLRYSWPGNVRELENAIRKLAVLSPGEVITQRDVTDDQELYEKITRFEDEGGGLASMEETERRQIEKALVEAGGNRTEAARMLGISRATIFRKMRRYGISQ